MKVVVMGAGILGVTSAWYLAEHGHEVIVVDRQPGAALETSFANGAQISVSFCEPWASAQAPWKVAQWMWRDDSPLLFRPRLDPAQWRWGLAFLANCHDAAFARNVAQLVALGRYSHTALKTLVQRTGIAYHRLQRGILHVFGSTDDFAAGVRAAELMRQHGVDRQVLGPGDVVAIEPALRQARVPIVGGIYTRSDESGDAHLFTRALAERCAARGVRFLYEHAIERIEAQGGRVRALHTRHSGGDSQRIEGDAFVAALGAHTSPMLQPLGVSLNIYPTKGYSVTLPLKRPDEASEVSLIDDARKVAISRLGDRLRIAGTAELAGYDTRLDTPTARVRCEALVQRCEELFPGVADTSAPQFWAGLRPSTPNNVPLIGRTHIDNLWVNAGHGTLGWTHGAGSGRALAELMSGVRPALDFHFLGESQLRLRGRVAPA
jgi:D-amino-acid dehydrogenase